MDTNICICLKYLACVAVTLSMVRGPLFQRASTVVNQERVLSGNTIINIAQFLPRTNFVAEDWQSRMQAYGQLSGDVLKVVQESATHNPIRLETGCAGECETTAKVSIASAVSIPHYCMFSSLRTRLCSPRTPLHLSLAKFT
jgi:hypothetical protein